MKFHWERPSALESLSTQREKPKFASLRAVLLVVLTFCSLALPSGCTVARDPNMPAVTFRHIPTGTGGGPELADHIGGQVLNPKAGDRVVVYAHNGMWWVQPFRSHPFTEVKADGSWDTVTHIGTEYAALLVTPGFEPIAKTPELPKVGGDVRAIGTAIGSSGKPLSPKTVNFSGYNWEVHSSPVNHGGELRDYEPANVWVDARGYLHLLIKQEGDQFRCAGISLTRSLGYGTYRFVVQDSTHLPPATVLAMFTRDERHDENDRAEMDIELSQWSRSQNRNADYVVQPYYIPENTVHFHVPDGAVTHVLRWEPGSAVFRSFLGESAGPQGKVMEHTFRTGVPVPSMETVHLDFYESFVPKNSLGTLQRPVEVVVEKFEYLP